jgi:two-component system response regulator HydG
MAICRTQKKGKKSISQRIAKRVVPVNNPEKSRSQTPTALDSKADYRALSERSCVGLYVIQKGRFRYVNNVLSDILGYASPKYLIGNSFLELIHPEDRKLVDQTTFRASPKAVPYQHVFRVFKKDGTVIWVRIGGSTGIYRAESANIGHLMDVTSFKEIENSMEKYKKIVDEVEDSVAEVDLKGNVTFANDAACRIFGHTQAETAGRNYRDFVDEETADRLFRAYDNILRTGVPGKHIIYEFTRTNDGMLRTVEDSVSLIRNHEGKIKGFRAVGRDITDRREAERELGEHRTRLEAIFGSVKDAIITVDPELRVIAANKSTEDVCGIAVKEVVGHVFPACLKECNKSCCEVLRQTLSHRKTIREYKIECGPQGSRKQIVSITSSPLLGPNDVFMGAVLVIRDVTLINDLTRELTERHCFKNVIGKSKKMQDIYQLLEKLGDLETTVLITGESGTGKDLIAKALHYSGQRSFKPLITVNCSALAENLLESELFGHVKGAFTGAICDKQGRFQLANGGSILLDEIGDISPLIQLKLLRVLEEKEFERVGESNPRKIDVRVIATTNKDLKEKVKRGEFREDLYYRLRVMEIGVPPLRERTEDLPLLVDHFRQSFNKKFRKDIEGVSTEVVRQFMDYPWPGNVRELEHVLERAFVICQGSVITLDHMPSEIRCYEIHPGETIPNISARSPRQAHEIVDALKRTDWNKAKAARLLGIDRSTIYRQMNKHQITRTE